MSVFFCSHFVLSVLTYASNYLFLQVDLNSVQSKLTDILAQDLTGKAEELNTQLEPIREFIGMWKLNLQVEDYLLLCLKYLFISSFAILCRVIYLKSVVFLICKVYFGNICYVYQKY